MDTFHINFRIYNHGIWFENSLDFCIAIEHSWFGKITKIIRICDADKDVPQNETNTAKKTVPGLSKRYDILV